MSIWALILYIYVGLNLAYAPFALAKKKEFKFDVDGSSAGPALAAVLFTVMAAALSWVIYELYVDSTYANALAMAVALWVIRAAVLLGQLSLCVKGRERYSVTNFLFDCFIGVTGLVAISMLAFA